MSLMVRFSSVLDLRLVMNVPFPTYQIARAKKRSESVLFSTPSAVMEDFQIASAALSGSLEVYNSESPFHFALEVTAAEEASEEAMENLLSTVREAEKCPRLSWDEAENAYSLIMLLRALNELRKARSQFTEEEEEGVGRIKILSRFATNESPQRFVLNWGNGRRLGAQTNLKAAETRGG